MVQVICGLACYSACSLIRRAVVQVWFEEARGLGPRGKLPYGAGSLPLGPRPRAKGSPFDLGWMML